MSSNVKQTDFSQVYGQTNVCTRLLSSERCSPLTQVWLTSFTGELRIIVMKLTFVAFLKTLTLYWFSIFLKRKILRVLDTWKKTQVYFRCGSPELHLRRHPSVATWMWWRVCLFSRWLPLAPAQLFLCWKTPYTPAALPCVHSWSAPAGERWRSSPPCARQSQAVAAAPWLPGPDPLLQWVAECWGTLGNVCMWLGWFVMLVVVEFYYYYYLT